MFLHAIVFIDKTPPKIRHINVECSGVVSPWVYADDWSMIVQFRTEEQLSRCDMEIIALKLDKTFQLMEYNIPYKMAEEMMEEAVRDMISHL